MPPPRPRPTRVVLFVDGQNLYHRCKEHFGFPWVHPRRLGEALVRQDRERYGEDSHVLTAVRYYTGIHDSDRRPSEHGVMERRLARYRADGVQTIAIPLRYDADGRGREKGIDVRLSLDLVRWGHKGLFDVAVVVSEDSDVDPAAQDVYALRDEERWVAVENALPWRPHSHPRWLPSVRRHRRIDPNMFDLVKDRG